MSEVSGDTSYPMVLTGSGNHFLHVVLEDLVSTPDIR